MSVGAIKYCCNKNAIYCLFVLFLCYRITRFDPHVRHNILSLRFGHENISVTILSLALIQERLLSDTGERMCIKYR